LQTTLEVSSTHAKCLQIGLLPGSTEYLPETEGLAEADSERLAANGLSKPTIVW
jgi:hypothetical protein